MTKRPEVKNLMRVQANSFAGGRGVQRVILDPDEKNENQISMFVNTFNAGAGQGSYHYHKHSDNVYIGIAGVIELFVGTERHLLRPNDMIFVPRGVPHSSGIGPEEREAATMLEIYAPPKPEGDSIIIERPASFTEPGL